MTMGQRCPHCELQGMANSKKWKAEDFPIMAKADFVDHLHTVHSVGRLAAGKTYAMRSPAHDEKVA